MTSVLARFGIVKDLFQRDLDLLVRELLPDARRAGNVWSARNPRRADLSAGSFVVWRTGAVGSWRDYASDDKGDVVDLVAFVKDWDRMEVVRWGEARYGIRHMSEGERRRLDDKARSARVVAARREADDELRKRQWAIDLFEAAEPRLRGTLVETYAEARGTPLSAMPGLEHQWFRFAPALEWWRGAERDPKTGRKIRPGPTYPALVSAMVDATGTMRAIHCTFLDHDGRRKAPVPGSPKLMFPKTRGLVIRVARGETRMTPEGAAKHGLIGPGFVGEGVEDAWTMTVAMPELRTIAAGSLSGLMNMPDLPCVDGWLVGRDNDWGKEHAADQFDRAMARIKGFGKPAEEISASAEVKDFNDMVRT